MTSAGEEKTFMMRLSVGAASARSRCGSTGVAGWNTVLRLRGDAVRGSRAVGYFGDKILERGEHVLGVVVERRHVVATG